MCPTEPICHATSTPPFDVRNSPEEWSVLRRGIMYMMETGRVMWAAHGVCDTPAGAAGAAFMHNVEQAAGG